MNLRVGARVLCSLSVDGVNSARAGHKRSRSRRLTRNNHRIVIWHAIREKPVAPNTSPHIYFALIEILSFGNKFFA